MKKYLSIIFAISLISGLFGCSSSENEESSDSSSVSESSEKETEKVTEKATEKSTEKITEKPTEEQTKPEIILDADYETDFIKFKISSAWKSSKDEDNTITFDTLSTLDDKVKITYFGATTDLRPNSDDEFVDYWYNDCKNYYSESNKEATVDIVEFNSKKWVKCYEAGLSNAVYMNEPSCTQYCCYNNKLLHFIYVYDYGASNIDETVSKILSSVEFKSNEPPTNKPTTPAVEEKPESNNVSLGEKNALDSAKSYIKFSDFSYEGLIDQLEYEKYSHEEAVYGADNCGADWNAEALDCAKSYIDLSDFSYQGLIEQLEYEKFTHEQSVYGADNCGADWNQEAADCAASYINFSSFSRQELVDQLIYEGFTAEQAEYGAQSVGY